ncbi:3-oxoacyl-ACP reductase FabG [Peribacillus asahii]|uniref:3-oxoacyl-ACP synthase n=1 Tax=Peribacillus asahii TaxID=228899 RepID=A0A3Q9RK74_9BACI|nr:3-oxoacyl-ACP reductase FabG [Peribacillus asahii]AZV41421.1 3-oxoacyl-ACP synthase [Peribacillus asahii]USK70916.1 3-oxoacyl-ACP reductase FabG [Peribacillus asahii]USK85825.1 3-oxoacyl-ACP reductase FabG [Peribacillus asahii]
MKLAGKVAIITGGAKGIGKVTAKRFLEEGAKVVICDYDQSAGQAALADLGSNDVSFFQVDVTNTAQVETMVQSTIDTYGRIDILINNAGITNDGFLVKMSEEAWEKVLAVNLSGVFKCTKAVAPFMLDQKSGVILNASSVVGIYGNIGQSNYVATKAGIIGMTKGWAKEFGPKGIRVNAIAPGFIATDMVSTVPQKVIDAMKEKTPLKKLGTPEDIAEAYLFLASDTAGYINGTILSVDGGLVV